MYRRTSFKRLGKINYVCNKTAIVKGLFHTDVHSGKLILLYSLVTKNLTSIYGSVCILDTSRYCAVHESSSYL